MHRIRRTQFFPGDVALAFNAEAPTAGQASQQFALPSYAGFPENGRTIRWQTSYATAPTSVQIQLQTAITDVDAQYSAPNTGNAGLDDDNRRQPGSVRSASELRESESDLDYGRDGRDGADFGIGYGSVRHRRFEA